MAVDVSVLVAAHREGRIAHKTLLSIKDALEELDKKNISHEVLVHIDRGDEATRQYFNHQKVLKISIHENSFGDLGDSRNYSIEKAQGKYVAVIDADDLISPNWLIAGYQYLKKQPKDLVVHTHYSVNFGEKNIIWPKSNSKSLDEERLIQVSDNRWDSAIMAKRSLLRANLYTKMSDGFAPEDWHFNSETLDKGIEHHIVPETTLFVRRKSESVMQRQADNFHTMGYTSLLEFEKVRKIDDSRFKRTRPAKENRWLKLGKKGLKVVRHYTVRLGKEFGPTRRLIARAKLYRDQRKAISRLKKDYVPEWLYQQWKAIHRHERQLFPSKKLQDSLEVYHSDFVKPRGFIYKQIADQLKGNNIDHIIFAPWLIHGGGDLVTIRYANTLAKQHPMKRIAVFTTENRQSTWGDKLADNVDFIEYGQLSNKITDKEQLKLLARVMVQAKVKSIQIINSKMAYDFVESHAPLLKKLKIKVYAAAFCQDINEEGLEGGYIHTHLPKAYESIDLILSENQNVIDKLVAEYGMDPERFRVHYQPAEEVSTSWEQPSGPVKLLWASRISLQKRPDLLVDIAHKMENSHPDIIIEAYGTLGKNFPNKIADSHVANLRYMGPYDGTDSLPMSQYRGYLYTSDYDGMPNAVLGAAGAGIPIIASNVGGISELIENGKSGFLVKNSKEDFIEAIDALLKKKPADVKRMTNRLREKLDFQHSQAEYEKAVKRDITL